MHMYHGILGLVIMILDIWAIISVVTSGASVAKKVLWTVAILILPILGFILWVIFGPRARRI